MLINVSTRKLRRAVRLPEGDPPIMAGDGTSKSAASRRFVAHPAERLAKCMASDLSKLDLLIIQIDGLHIGNDLVLVAALGIDGNGDKHPLPFGPVLTLAPEIEIANPRRQHHPCE
jgi:putative transposase